MRATYTLDPKKKYIISLKYTAGSNNNLALQDDKGYITTTDGTATTALQVGNHYAAVISASTSVVITATSWNTSYTINNIHLSEYDAGYTDDSGKGKFQYQPPTGFLALCEDNLPTPTIADPGDPLRRCFILEQVLLEQLQVLDLNQILYGANQEPIQKVRLYLIVLGVQKKDFLRWGHKQKQHLLVA